MVADSAGHVRNRNHVYRNRTPEFRACSVRVTGKGTGRQPLVAAAPIQEES